MKDMLGVKDIIELFLFDFGSPGVKTGLTLPSTTETL